jgi:glycosyltransferase involved in cell wall biosynthesis
MKLGIVIPCYNEEAVLRETHMRIQEVVSQLTSTRKIAKDSGIWFVDDGSTDATWDIIKELATQNPEVHGIKLSRNRGHQSALLAGLQVAEGDALISIDADLQDDVGVVNDMVDEFLSGCDVVYGVRSNRESDSRFKRWSAEGYYKLLRAMGADVVFNHADYRLLSRRAVQHLGEYREVNLFLRGIVPLLGFRTAEVGYNRAERAAGDSKYPLRKMLGLALDGITSFTAFPLRLITLTGLVIFLVSILAGLWALSVRLFTDAAIPGWTSTVVPFYFLGGVQLLCIGIIGEYLGKIYLEVKGRPRYHIERII